MPLILQGTSDLVDDLTSMASEADKPAILTEMQALTAGMDEGSLTECYALLTQIQSLLDSGLTEDEVAALFPGIDLSGELDQFTGIASYLDIIKTDLPELYSMFGESLPSEVLTISTDLDMTGAKARWAEFAADPGVITTEAVIVNIRSEEAGNAQAPMVEALISKYTVTDDADVTSLSLTGLVAYVGYYAEQIGCDASGLTPDNVTALVAAYEELASGADISTLYELVG